MKKIELRDGRGHYVHPTAEQIQASGMSDVELRMWQAVEAANTALTEARTALADAQLEVQAAQAALDVATKELAALSPPMTHHQLVREFLASQSVH